MRTARTWPAGPVWLALRADLRLRWRATLGLVLLLGLIGGVVLTAAAGARRTDTAYPRLLRWSHAASVLVVPNCTGLDGFYRRLARLPQVASIWTGVVYTLALPPPALPGSQLEAVASPDGALGTSTDRVRVLAGRPFDPADPRAVMVDQELAAAAHVRPGGTLRLLGDPSTAKTCAAGGGTAAASRAPRPAGPAGLPGVGDRRLRRPGGALPRPQRRAAGPAEPRLLAQRRRPRVRPRGLRGRAPAPGGQPGVVPPGRGRAGPA